jgi:hypothetical protein
MRRNFFHNKIGILQGSGDILEKVYSYMEEVVKQQLDIFESLSNKSVSGEKKIAEVEKDSVSKVTKELTDGNEN